MTVYYSGSPLSNLFDPYVEGTKQCPAGEIFENGVDVRNKYAPASVGSKRGGVGVLIGGTDISNYFAQKGSASYATAPWDGVVYSEYMSAGGYIDININFHADGTFSVGSYTSQGHRGSLGSGRWVSAAQVSNYELYSSISSSSSIVVTNEISTYKTVSSSLKVNGRIAQSHNAGVITGTLSFYVRIRRKGQTNYINSTVTFQYRIGTPVDGGGDGGGGINPN